MEEAFWSVFSSGPILDCLGQHLEIAEIVNLSRTCHGLSGLYYELMPQCWDVDRLLKRFVRKPTEFRYQIGLAEALITGSFALEFFERPRWQAPNIDIVVRDERGVMNLMAYLSCYETYKPDKKDDGPPPEDMPHGFRFVDQVRLFSSPNPRMQVRIANESPDIHLPPRNQPHSIDSSVPHLTPLLPHQIGDRRLLDYKPHKLHLLPHGLLHLPLLHLPHPPRLHDGEPRPQLGDPPP